MSQALFIPPAPTLRGEAIVSRPFPFGHILYFQTMARNPLETWGPNAFRTPIIPIEFLKTLLPEPGTLGADTKGKTCIGNWIEGTGKDGKPLMDEKGKSIIVERPVTLPRWTLVIGPDGKLAAKRTTVNPVTEADAVLRIVEALGR